MEVSSDKSAIKMKVTRASRSISFLPYRSARRPVIGVETAPASRVTVMIHDAFAAEVLKICGSWVMSGMMRVCARETKTPPAARAAMTGPGRTGGEGCVGEAGPTAEARVEE